MRNSIVEIMAKRRQYHDKDGREYGIYGKTLLTMGDASYNDFYDTIQFLEDTTFSRAIDYELMANNKGTLSIDEYESETTSTNDSTTTDIAVPVRFNITRIEGVYFNELMVGSHAVEIEGEKYVVAEYVDEDTLVVEGDDIPDAGEHGYEFINMYEDITFPAGLSLLGLFYKLVVSSGACVCYKSREQ